MLAMSERIRADLERMAQEGRATVTNTKKTNFHAFKTSFCSTGLRSSLARCGCCPWIQSFCSQQKAHSLLSVLLLPVLSWARKSVLDLKPKKSYSVLLFLFRFRTSLLLKDAFRTFSTRRSCRFCRTAMQLWTFTWLTIWLRSFSCLLSHRRSELACSHGSQRQIR